MLYVVADQLRDQGGKGRKFHTTGHPLGPGGSWDGLGVVRGPGGPGPGCRAQLGLGAAWCLVRWGLSQLVLVRSVTGGPSGEPRRRLEHRITLLHYIASRTNKSAFSGSIFESAERHFRILFQRVGFLISVDFSPLVLY